MMTNPKGRFGIHGGQYIPETLMNAVLELELNRFYFFFVWKFFFYLRKARFRLIIFFLRERNPCKLHGAFAHAVESEATLHSLRTVN